MHASPADFTLEPVPTSRGARSRRPVLRSVPDQDPEQETPQSAASAEPDEARVLVTVVREIAAATGMILWLGGCIVAASMLV